MATLVTDLTAVATDFKDVRYVYLHCVEQCILSIRMENFPAVLAKVRMCHISVPATDEKRVAFIADVWENDHLHFPVPKILELKCSCEVEVRIFKYYLF